MYAVGNTTPQLEFLRQVSLPAHLGRKYPNRLSAQFAL